MLMNIPQHGFTVGINENLKIKFKPKQKRIKYLWYFLCAGVAGAIAVMITNPLDVIKTRL